MKTIAVISQKGGSGKTTISLNLAIAATAKGKNTVVIDIDPQQSATRWARLRSQAAPLIIAGHGPNLADLIAGAKEGGAQLVIIDTAPKSEGASLTAAKLADLVLVPCQPSSLDLDAIADTVNIAALAKKPAIAVLNNCRASSTLAEQAEEALSAQSLTVVGRLGSRVAYIKSLADGMGVIEFEPNGAAAREMKQLYMLIAKQVHL